MDLLTKALREQGAAVESLEGARLSLLRLAFRNNRPDIVHLQWQHGFLLGTNWPMTLLRTILFFLQLWVLKGRGVAVVWTVHNITNHEGRFRKWELRASRRLAHTADAMLVHCRAAAREVTASYGIGAEHIYVVPHGHYANAYPKPLDRAEARNDLGLPDGAKILLFFGQIRRYKGVEKLIDAFARIDSADARLVIVGEPRPRSLGKSISSLASGKENVSLHLGRADSETLVRFICASDVVALPYLHSLTSGASILAGTYARPVIAPKRGCLAELPDSAAILYEGQDVSDLQSAIEKSLSASLDEMGQAARDYVLSYPWSTTAGEIMGVYSEVLGRN